jgi:hypothetical protein
MEAIEEMILEIQGASPARQGEIYQSLEALCQGKTGTDVRSAIEKHARAQVLTIQWELEELLERSAPEPIHVPEPEKEEEVEAPTDAQESSPIDPYAPLTDADVEVVFEDPKGLILHCTKDGKRWLATQVDPQSGEPQTFELQRQEIDQLKDQLANSPYWVLGKNPA